MLLKDVLSAKDGGDHFVVEMRHHGKMRMSKAHIPKELLPEVEALAKASAHVQAKSGENGADPVVRDPSAAPGQPGNTGDNIAPVQAPVVTPGPGADPNQPPYVLKPAFTGEALPVGSLGSLNNPMEAPPATEAAPAPGRTLFDIAFGDKEKPITQQSVSEERKAKEERDAKAAKEAASQAGIANPAENLFRAGWGPIHPRPGEAPPLGSQAAPVFNPANPAEPVKPPIGEKKPTSDKVTRVVGAKGPPLATTDPDFEAGQRRQQEAIALHGLEEQRHFDEIGKIQNKNVADIKTATAEWEGLKKHNQAIQQEYRQKIATGQLDPNGIWKDVEHGGGGGNLILASIGIALGSFGSALAKTPNYALQIVNDAINRNMESQRFAMSKNKDLLESYRQQGLDLDDVLKMQRANLLGIAGAQIEAEGARFGSATAVTNAQAAGGALQAKGVQDRLAVAHGIWSNQWEPIFAANNAAESRSKQSLMNLQIEGAKKANAAAEEQRASLKAAMASAAAGRANGYTPDEVALVYQLKTNPAEAGKYRVAVPIFKSLPDGKGGGDIVVEHQDRYGSDEDAAKKAREVFRGIDLQTRNLNKLEDLLTKYGAWGGIVGTGAKEIRAAAHAVALGTPKNTEGMSRYTELEQEAAQAMAGDPESFASRLYGDPRAVIEQSKAMLQKDIEASSDAYLLGGSRVK